MNYEEPVRMSRFEEVEGLSSANRSEVLTTMVNTAFFEEDRAWAEQQFLRLLRSDDVEIRGLAATCIGHLARIHRTLSSEALATLKALKEDSVISSQVSDALDDIETFVN